MADASGAPVPLGPEALEVAAQRGEGEDVERHDRGGAEPQPRMAVAVTSGQDDDAARAAVLATG